MENTCLFYLRRIFESSTPETNLKKKKYLARVGLEQIYLVDDVILQRRLLNVENMFVILVLELLSE